MNTNSSKLSSEPRKRHVHRGVVLSGLGMLGLLILHPTSALAQTVEVPELVLARSVELTNMGGLAGLAVDGDTGNVYVICGNGSDLCVLHPDNSFGKLAVGVGSFNGSASDLAIGPDRVLYAVSTNTNPGPIQRFELDGTQLPPLAQLPGTAGNAAGLAFDCTGRLYASDTGNVLYQVTPDGSVSPFSYAWLDVDEIESAPDNVLFVHDGGSAHQIFHVSPQGIRTVFAEDPTSNLQSGAFDWGEGAYYVGNATRRTILRLLDNDHDGVADPDPVTVVSGLPALRDVGYARSSENPSVYSLHIALVGTIVEVTGLRPPMNAGDCGSHVDDDGDGFCEAGEDINRDGDCLDDNEEGVDVDCDDRNAARSPKEAELCDGIDNNCNTDVDEGYVELGLRCSVGVGACERTSLWECRDDGLGLVCQVNAGVPTKELCDGVDNDCNGLTDETYPQLGHVCENGVGACASGGVYRCASSGSSTVCDATPKPASVEICGNQVDEDCDGVLDNGCELLLDNDSDGFCERGRDLNQDGDCMDPAEDSPPYDCNDSDPNIRPNAGEVCGNDVDENCDGHLNDGCLDTDGDGLLDEYEAEIGTDPHDADTDDDGVPDGEEASLATDSDGDGLLNALDPDSDNDALPDGLELGYGCDAPGTDLTKGFCRADGDLGATKTNPLLWDTDGGGASDGSEDTNRNGTTEGLETVPSLGIDDTDVADSDQDGLADALEASLRSKWDDGDSDDDGLPDGMEPNPSLDMDGDGLIGVIDTDSDDDGLFDGTESGLPCSTLWTDVSADHCVADRDLGTTVTFVLVADSDRGGARDGSEDANRNGVRDGNETEPAAGFGADDRLVIDTDKDGWSDAFELALGSNPRDRDSDDDGLLDGLEHNPADDQDVDSKPGILDEDSDGDGLFDGLEAGMACGVDTDLSKETCTSDGDRGETKTFVLLSDTDRGGVDDGVEDRNHNGWVDPGETDPNNPSDDNPCRSDADCGNPDDGVVCDAATSTCVPGCRGKGEGARCPPGRVCSSSDGTIGTCTEAPDGGTLDAPGTSANQDGSAEAMPEVTTTAEGDQGGCGCHTGPARSHESFAWLVLAWAIALRRRDRQNQRLNHLG